MINLMILPVDPVHVQNQLDREIAEMVSVFKSKIIWFAEKKTNELSAARRGSEGDTSGPEVGVAGRLRGVELPYERM